MTYELGTDTALKYQAILILLFSVPADGFLLGCVFAIADYPEQMADKQLLATWKRVSQSHCIYLCLSLTHTHTHVFCSFILFLPCRPQVIQACGGSVDSALTGRSTHLLCESQVSNMYVQVSTFAPSAQLFTLLIDV